MGDSPQRGGPGGHDGLVEEHAVERQLDQAGGQQERVLQGGVVGKGSGTAVGLQLRGWS